MPDVMKQNSRQGTRCLAVAYLHPFAPQRSNPLAHQVHSTYGMEKTAVHRTGIHQIGKSQLPDTVETLDIRMLQHIVEQVARNGEKSEYGVVDYLPFVGYHLYMRQGSHFCQR